MRRVAFLVTALLWLSVPLAAYASPQPANERASCVAVITSFEASQLSAGFVGAEVSGLATADPGVLGELAQALAKEHAGSIEECFEAEG